MALGDAQDFVDRRDPVAEQGFFGEDGAENSAQGDMQGLSLCEEGGGALRVVLGEREQLGASFWRDDSSSQEEMEKVFPGELGGCC